MRKLLVLCMALLSHSAGAADIDARQLVQQAMDHWRGLTSYSEMNMTIHRPDWERSMTMKSWMSTRWAAWAPPRRTWAKTTTCS